MRGEPLQLPFTLNRAEPLLCSYLDFYLEVQVANATSWEEGPERSRRIPGCPPTPLLVLREEIHI